MLERKKDGSVQIRFARSNHIQKKWNCLKMSKTKHR